MIFHSVLMLSDKREVRVKNHATSAILHPKNRTTAFEVFRIADKNLRDPATYLIRLAEVPDPRKKKGIAATQWSFYARIVTVLSDSCVSNVSYTRRCAKWVTPRDTILHLRNDPSGVLR